MLKETTFLGIAGIVLGIAIIFKTHTIIPALIPIIIGIALIICRKEEGKIENRKDIKQKKLKTNMKESKIFINKGPALQLNKFLYFGGISLF